MENVLYKEIPKVGKTRELIAMAMDKIILNDEDPTYVNIAKYSGFTINTINRYKPAPNHKAYSDIQAFKNRFFKNRKYKFAKMWDAQLEMGQVDPSAAKNIDSAFDKTKSDASVNINNTINNQQNIQIAFNNPELKSLEPKE